jgi:hypothetical protein
VEDHQHAFEERALKNVRALVDKLEREAPHLVSDRGTVILCAVILAAVVIFGGLVEWSSRQGRGQADAPACLAAAMAARVAEAERQLRESRPDLSPRTISRIAGEDPRTSAKAKADCDASTTWK